LEFEHIPVLLGRVLEAMPLKEGAVVVDGTLGLGGYSEAFLKSDSSWQVIGIDRDEKAREIARERLAQYGERFRILAGNFRDMKSLCLASGVPFADCVVLDLGVSNMQLVDGERGFSFREDGPLDMRMDREKAGPTAADLVNGLSREALTDIFRKYGEERFAWKIAGEIVAMREKRPFKTTGQLVEALRKALPAPVMRKMTGHPARKVFQALRIAVNDELGALEQGLREAFELLAVDGRLLVVTYHSLEDRIVKHQMRQWSDEGLGIMEPRRGIVPDDEEIQRNPKSRSARLRGFHKKNLPTSKEGKMGPWRRY
jgi:16S rRNA (cytosine1402-N4)-methyltransferase